MTILKGDIKLVASQVMADVPEGGGAPSGVVIPDGASNGVFPDISELDRAGGRVNLRKLFGHVRTANVDGYFGMNVIIAKPFADPRVSATLFASANPFERRAAAVKRVESYLGRGPAFQGYLYGDHLAGQGALLVLQRQELALPGVGDTFVLQAGDVEQYVRIKSLAASVRTFTDSDGDFTRTMLTLELTNVLTSDFPGFDALRQDAKMSFVGKTKMFETVVADAARYYGVVPLGVAAAMGDTTLKATGIFTQLVPSTRLEVPLADARVNQQASANVSGGSPDTATFDLAWTTAQPLFVGCSIVPGSFSITRAGTTVTDKGGVLYNGGTAVGTFDYSNGIASLSTNIFGTSVGSHSATFTPSAQPTVVTDSLGIVVTQAGQRLTWVYTLDPVPARGSLTIAYRALGKWYTLTDDGSGALRGSDSSYGAGTLNFTTGTVSLTLGALPDVNSRIISAWAPTASSRSLITTPANVSLFNRKVRRRVELGVTLKPGTLTLTWNDGVARTATDVDGALTGDASGSVFYGAGAIDFTPNTLPAQGTVVNVVTSLTTQRKAAVASFTDSGSTWTFSLGGAVKPRSVQLGVVAQYAERVFPGSDVTQKRSLLVFDDGAGNLVIGSLSTLLTVGTVNYSTGACSITKVVGGLQTDQPTFATKTPIVSGDATSFIKQTGYETRTVTVTFLNGNGGTTLGLPAWAWWSSPQTDAAQYRASGTDGASGQTYSFIVDELAFPIIDYTVDPSVERITRLVSFKLGASRYVTANNGAGTMWRDPLPATGEGAVGGRVDQVWAYVTSWQVGASPLPTALNGAQSAAVQSSGSLIDTVTSRTAVSPLVPSSFSVAGNWADGTAFTATADSNGFISSGTANVGSTPGTYGVFGKIDYETGVIDLRFGRRVNATGVGIIDASAVGVPGVAFIESRGVAADTLRYNAVGYRYLPLDPDILGLNTVRLPPDGRVPIFREGTFVVVSNEKPTTPATVTAGQTINCARVRLARVRVVGNNGLTISTGYTEDLDAGTVTFTDVTGYSQPVKVLHTVEDMQLLSEVQIDGRLSFTRALTHDYPVDGTYVSSALVIGDVKARVSLTFDQQSWNNVWQDTVNGVGVSATYNDIQYPIEVTNAGALTERWAIVFASNNTTFSLIGENVGVVATGSVNADFAPLNPTTSQPYLTIKSAGWGGGWSAGNVLRINTIGAIPDFWDLRTVLQGPETVTDDSHTVLLRGDVDRP